jgi:hypothetical protein
MRSAFIERELDSVTRKETRALVLGDRITVSKGRAIVTRMYPNVLAAVHFFPTIDFGLRDIS